MASVLGGEIGCFSGSREAWIWLVAKKLCSYWRAMSRIGGSVSKIDNNGERGPRTGQRIEDQEKEQK